MAYSKATNYHKENVFCECGNKATHFLSSAHICDRCYEIDRSRAEHEDKRRKVNGYEPAEVYSYPSLSIRKNNRTH